MTPEELKTAPAWQISRAAYQARAGVYQPHIGEISSVQYARLSKRGKAVYDAKRAEEWDASARCYDRYKKEVLDAYDAGAFTVRINGSGTSTEELHSDARSIVYGELVSSDKAAIAKADRELSESNDIEHSAVNVGDRLWDVIYHGYVTVEKKNRLTLRVSDGKRSYSKDARLFVRARTIFGGRRKKVDVRGRTCYRDFQETRSGTTFETEKGKNGQSEDRDSGHDHNRNRQRSSSWRTQVDRRGGALCEESSIRGRQRNASASRTNARAGESDSIDAPSDQIVTGDRYVRFTDLPQAV